MIPYIPSHSTQVPRICISPINTPRDSHELLPNLVNPPYFRDKHLLQFNSHLGGSIRSCTTESPKLRSKKHQRSQKYNSRDRGGLLNEMETSLQKSKALSHILNEQKN